MLRLTVQTLKIVSILAVAILIIAGSKAGFDYALGQVADPRAGEKVPFQVTQDDSGDSVAARLADADLIRIPSLFTTNLRFAGNLLPGDYTLERGMSVNEIIDQITDHSGTEVAVSSTDAVPSASPTEAQIIENQRMEQDAQTYADAGLTGGADAFMNAVAQDYTESFPFLAGRPAGATLEGYLFPATYSVTSALTPEDAVFQMLTTFDQRFTQELRDQAAAANLTMHQVVTLASIVEREVQAPAERPTVAAVYLNRLKAGMTLDADPTVQYVIGTAADWWPVLEPNQPKSPEAQSPYNTYVNKGLPPGPICSPSYDSIYAVLNPDPVDYLYFVAKNDGSGEHAFATTLDEQTANINTYLNNGDAQPTETPAP